MPFTNFSVVTGRIQMVFTPRLIIYQCVRLCVPIYIWIYSHVLYPRGLAELFYSWKCFFSVFLRKGKWLVLKILNVSKSTWNMISFYSFEEFQSAYFVPCQSEIPLTNRLITKSLSINSPRKEKVSVKKILRNSQGNGIGLDNAAGLLLVLYYYY